MYASTGLQKFIYNRIKQDECYLNMLCNPCQVCLVTEIECKKRKKPIFFCWPSQLAFSIENLKVIEINILFVFE